MDRKKNSTLSNIDIRMERFEQLLHRHIEIITLNPIYITYIEIRKRIINKFHLKFDLSVIIIKFLKNLIILVSSYIYR